MAKQNFRWDNIPDEVVPEFIEAVFDDYKKKVLEIHDKYKVSDYNYKCCDLSSLLVIARDEISKGKLKR